MHVHCSAPPCSSSSIAAQNAIDKRASALTEEESGIAEQRVRFDAERRIALLSEITAIKVSLSELVAFGFT